MTQSLQMLVWFAVWALVLVVAIGLIRVTWIVTRSPRMKEIRPGVKHGPDWYWRLNRCHLNAVENLPIFGALVLGTHVAGLETPMVGTLSTVVVGARIVQTFIYIASWSLPAVAARFGAYLVQVGCFSWMAAHLLGVF